MWPSYAYIMANRAANTSTEWTDSVNFNGVGFARTEEPFFKYVGSIYVCS